MTNVIEEVQLKRGPSTNVVAAPLKRGEPALALDTKELWVGDGTGKIKISDTYFYNTFSNLPITGEEEKLYIIKDTGSFYLWDQSIPGYKKYEFDADGTVVHCRLRTMSYLTFPTNYEDIFIDINDGETDPTKLHQDPNNPSRLVFEEKGWYCIKSRLNYEIPSQTGGYTTINSTVKSRILVDNSLFIPESEDIHMQDIYFVHTNIADTLTSDFIYWFDAGQYITLQIMNEGDTANVLSAKLEAYKISTIKGEKGEPGPPGSIWHNGSGVPLLTLGNNNDYYLDNDTKDVYQKLSDSWNLTSNIAGGPPGPEGPPGSGFEEIYHTSSDSLQQTTNDVFQNKVKLNLIGLEGGEYRIGFYYEYNYNNRSHDFMGRVRVDNSINIMEHRREPKDIKSTQFTPIGGFKYETLSAGDHVIDLDWCCSSLGDTASIRRARLEIWKK